MPNGGHTGLSRQACKDMLNNNNSKIISMIKKIRREPRNRNEAILLANHLLVGFKEDSSKSDTKRAFFKDSNNIIWGKFNQEKIAYIYNWNETNYWTK